MLAPFAAPPAAKPNTPTDPRHLILALRAIAAVIIAWHHFEVGRQP